MTELERISEEYYQERPEGFGNPIDDFIAGFRKARQIIAKRMGEAYSYPDGKGLWMPLMINQIGDEPVLAPPVQSETRAKSET